MAAMTAKGIVIAENRSLSRVVAKGAEQRFASDFTRLRTFLHVQWYISPPMIIRMKRRDLEKRLTEYGWWLARHGGNHDIWTNGNEAEPIPRHSECNEYLAKKILKKAKDNPPKER